MYYIFILVFYKKNKYSNVLYRDVRETSTVPVANQLGDQIMGHSRNARGMLVKMFFKFNSQTQLIKQNTTRKHNS